MAWYQSSYGTVCKTVLRGCNPHPGLKDLPGWRNGLRTTLKMLRAKAHVGSTPTPGTNKKAPHVDGELFMLQTLYFVI